MCDIVIPLVCDCVGCVGFPCFVLIIICMIFETYRMLKLFETVCIVVPKYITLDTVGFCHYK